MSSHSRKLQVDLVLHKTSVFVLILCVSSAVSTPTCPEDHFWDSGVDNCEHCRDICVNAERQKTVEACQQNCPAYSKKMNDDRKEVQKPDTVTGSSQDERSSGANTGFGIGLAAAGAIAVVVVATFVVFIVRRWLRKRRPAQATPASVSYVGVQESHNGRQGKQAIALLGSSREEVDEEDETLTKIFSPIYTPPAQQAASFTRFSLVNTKL